MLRVVRVGVAVLVLAAACTSDPPEVLSGTPRTAPETTAPETTESTVTTAPSTTTTSSVEPGAAPTLVLRGGPILTMDPNMDPDATTPTAVAVTGNEITGVGDEDEIMALAGEDTVVVDLEGRALLPGFVDAHSHYFAQAETLGLDLIGVQNHVLSQGITTLAEAAVDPILLAGLGQLYTDDFIRPRVSLYLMYNDSCGEGAGTWIPPTPAVPERGERLRIGGVKIFTDGGACNTPAVSYLDEPGDLYFDEVALTRVIAQYDEAGYQVLVHALGDQAIDVALRSFATVTDGTDNPLRHRIDHNAVVPPDMRDRYDESGAVAVIFGAYPTCSYQGRDPRFRVTTPAEYQEWEWPWRDLIDLNPETTFAWHGDFPVFVDSGPIASLSGFVTRSQTLANGTECLPEPDQAKHALTVDEALGMMTMGAAYALGRDEEVGSLEPGKLADLVVLSADPTAIPAEDLDALAVELTVLDGEAVFCAEAFDALCAPAEGREPMLTASASLLANPPSQAADGDLDTHWGSGSPAPQWIEVELGAPTQVAGVRLVTDQSPAGFTRHVVSGRDATGTLTVLGEVAGETDNRDVLEVDFNRPVTVTAIRIETVDSPSWVSWAEIEVIPAE